MPTWLAVVIIVMLALIVLLAVGGYLGNARKRREESERLHAQVEEANLALAAAHAVDRGWERATLESAARAAYEAANPGAPASELTLVQVIDRPGTDEDKAVFRIVTALGETRLTMGRHAGAWQPE